MKVEKKEFNNSNLKFFYQRECLKKKKDKIHQIIKINGQNTHVKRKKKKGQKTQLRQIKITFSFYFFSVHENYQKGQARIIFFSQRKEKKYSHSLYQKISVPNTVVTCALVNPRAHFINCHIYSKFKLQAKFFAVKRNLSRRFKICNVSCERCCGFFFYLFI